MNKDLIYEFPVGSVPVSVAAKVYGKDPCWVRTGIIAGWLPIGVATRDGEQITDPSMVDSKYGRINFYISPKKLYTETGYVWKGEKNTPSYTRDGRHIGDTHV